MLDVIALEVSGRILEQIQPNRSGFGLIRTPHATTHTHTKGRFGGGAKSAKKHFLNVFFFFGKPGKKGKPEHTYLDERNALNVPRRPARRACR